MRAAHGLFTVQLTAILVANGCGTDDRPQPTVHGQPGAVTATVKSDSGDYVNTPMGRFHKSCVHQVPNGAVIDANQNVFLNGALIAHFDGCAYPAERTSAAHPKISHSPADSSGAPPPETDGWVEYSSADVPYNAQGVDWLADFIMHWNVPAAPSSYVGQTIYLFNSMESTSSPAIIQPVLQYGPSPAGGGNYWSVASWYVSSVNDVMVTALTPVQEGAYLRGEIAPSSGSCDSSGECFWGITMFLNDSTVLSNLQTWLSERYDTIQKAVLEVYSVTDCSQYPASSAVFRNFYAAQDPGFIPKSYGDFSWNNVVPGGSPDCGFSVVGSGDVTLNY